MIPFPDKKYSIILADPPWQYQDKGCLGNAESQYMTLTIHNIRSLPIKTLASKDCALFLWATWPLLHDCLSVINAWGFEYKTLAFIWIKLNKNTRKPHLGLGHWTRSNSEPCFLALKGKPARIAVDVPQVILSPLRQHSRKPDEQYGLIERLLGKLPRIELFARQSFIGWDVWGNQASAERQDILK